MVNIWLPKSNEDGNKTEIITRNVLYVTDENKYKDLMKRLDNFKEYINPKTAQKFKEENDFIKELGCKGRYSYYRVDDGVEISYQDDIDLYWGESPTVKAHYINPLATLRRLVDLPNSSNNSNTDCIYINSREKDFILKELLSGSNYSFDYIILKLKQEKISQEEARQFLNLLSDNFRYFVTEGIDCLDFKVCEEYNTREITTSMPIIEREIAVYNKLNNDIAKEHRDLLMRELEFYKRVLIQANNARRNQEVLTLAKKLKRSMG